MTLRGGKRSGAGRPPNTGKYLCLTKPIRVPEDMIDEIETYIKFNGYELPLYSNKVAAGIPAPADDHIEGKLNLNHKLVPNPVSTFFVRVIGDSMINVGIHPGGILVVDRSLEATHNKIVIAVVNSELTVKRLYKKSNVIKLLPENSKYEPIEIKKGTDLHIWGVVTSAVHEF